MREQSALRGWFARRVARFAGRHLIVPVLKNRTFHYLIQLCDNEQIGLSKDFVHQLATDEVHTAI